MKAHYQHLGFGEESSGCECYWVKADQFGFHWHYHPELEITYVRKGRGTRLVGNHVSSFRDGDFVLLGSNLPHTWISDDEYNDSDEQVEVIVLQFELSLFREGMLSLSPFRSIQRMIHESHRGMLFEGEPKAIDLLESMVELEGIPRLQQLISLLDHLSQSDDVRLLAAERYSPKLQEETEERFQQVCRFIHERFSGSVSLEEVSDIAGMTPSSFCRFFKRMTGQTLIEYTTELRISKATNLLIDHPGRSIADIGFVSGFQSQSLFNRSFKRLKGMSPGQFRKNFER